MSDLLEVLHDSGGKAGVLYDRKIAGDVIINGVDHITGWRDRLRGAGRLLRGKQVIANRAVVITDCIIQGRIKQEALRR